LKVSGVGKVDGGRNSEPYEKFGSCWGGDTAPDPCEVSVVCVPVLSFLLLISVSATLYMLFPALHIKFLLLADKSRGIAGGEHAVKWWRN
jgi:hypothetical protein